MVVLPACTSIYWSKDKGGKYFTGLCPRDIGIGV